MLNKIVAVTLQVLASSKATMSAFLADHPSTHCLESMETRDA
jgi:hypothetical protein